MSVSGKVETSPPEANEVASANEQIKERDERNRMVSSKKETICEFLDKNRSYDIRLRVAKNFCIAVCSAKKDGSNIGRLHPGKILIDSRNCGVFLLSKADTKQALGAHQENPEKTPAKEEPYDAFFHVYAIMQGAAGSRVEKTAWGEDCSSHPTAEEMSSAILAERSRPQLVCMLDKASQSDRFSGPFWNEPAWKKSLYERYVPIDPNVSEYPQNCLEGIAFEVFSQINRPIRFTSRRHLSLGDRLKNLLSGGGEERNELKKNERRSIGSRGLSQTTLFWSATMGTSIMLGLLSALCGYSPLDVLFYPKDLLALPSTSIVLRFQYLITAFLGCMLCNTLLVKRNPLRGFERKAYFKSVWLTLAIMSVSRLAVNALAGEAL